MECNDRIDSFDKVWNPIIDSFRISVGVWLVFRRHIRVIQHSPRKLLGSFRPRLRASGSLNLPTGQHTLEAHERANYCKTGQAMPSKGLQGVLEPKKSSTHQCIELISQGEVKQGSVIPRPRDEQPRARSGAFTARSYHSPLARIPTKQTPRLLARFKKTHGFL
jgi:hypothetical protein